MSQQETHFLSNKGVSLFSNLEGPSLHFLSPLFPLPFSLPPPLPSSVSYVLKLPFCPCTTFPSIQLRNLEDLSMPAYSTSCSTSSMASVSSKLMTNLAYQPLNSRCKTCFGGVDWVVLDMYTDPLLVFKNAKNALYIAGFCTYNLKIFPGGDTPGTPQREWMTPSRTHLQHGQRILDPDTNFRLARQRCHCSCFTKRPLTLAVAPPRPQPNFRGGLEPRNTHT